MTEQRKRFDEWWAKYVATRLMVSTGGDLWAPAEQDETVAWRAWMAAVQDVAEFSVDTEEE